MTARGSGGNVSSLTRERSRSASNRPPSSFPFATQPDVVLSMERDTYYAHTLLGESVSELLEGLIGSRRSSLLGPEIKMLAAGLYYGLTKFSGKQTLGQEYCDVLLVGTNWKSRSGVRDAIEDKTLVLLSPASMKLYTVLHVVIPYFQGRLKEGWHGLRYLRDPFGRRITGSNRTVSMSNNVQGDPVVEGLRVRGRDATSPLAVPSTEGTRNPLTAMIHVRRWVRRQRRSVAAVLDWLQRLHLTFFYFNGRYQSFAMRALGARLMYNRAQDEPRAKYTILGLFLLVQVAAEAATAIQRQISASLRSHVGGASGEQGQVSVDGEDALVRTSKFLCGYLCVDNAIKAKVPATGPQETPPDAVLFPSSHRRCSLCMAPREYASATPCGHLFCWECIVGWCQTNPECPLCRQPVQPQAIVCLCQYA
ncbi:unnamed protein product [Choristocarpus tenellus]